MRKTHLIYVILTLLLCSFFLSLTANVIQKQNGDDRFWSITPVEDSDVIMKWGGIASDPKAITALSKNKEYHLISWNLHKGEDEGWSDDFTRYLQNKDFVLGQEAFQQTMESLWSTIPGWDWTLATSFLKGCSATGVVSGSRYLAFASTFLRSPVVEPVVGTPKMVLIQKFNIQKEKEVLWTVNVHAINFVSVESFKMHLNQIETALKSHTGPLILAGDFNSWNSARMEFLQQMMTRLKLQAVTFNPDTRSTFFGYPLDHIFTRGIKVVRSEVYSDISSSDHFPLLIDWTL